MKQIILVSTVFIFAALQGCSQQKPAVVSQCSIDALDGADRLPDGNFVAVPNAKLTAGGWFADIHAGQSPEKVTFILVNESGNVFLQGSAAPNISRPDVAQVFNKESLKNTGFSVGFQLNSNVPSATYSIVLNGEFDGKTGVCSTNKSLKISN